MRVGAFVFGVLAVAFAARASHAITASEVIIFTVIFSTNNLTSTSETVPQALMDANANCPCLTEVGCVRTAPSDQATFFSVNPTPPSELLPLFILLDTLALADNTINSVEQCVNLNSIGTGCPAGSAPFGTSECDACTGAGMVWCPGTQYMPPSCFDASAPVRTYGTNLTNPYDLKNLVYPGQVYGTAQTYGLARSQLLSFDPSQGGCPFSPTDTPITLTSGCPAMPVCTNCTLQPGGTCACESAGCCTEERSFWKSLSPWPAQCAPDITRGTALFGTSTMGAVISQPSKGDPCIGLAHAYITAKLNICGNGACTDTVVDDALASAVNYLYDANKCPGNIPKSEKKIVRSISSTLNAFNSGIIGPGSCSEVGAYADAGLGGASAAAASASATASTQTGLLITILVFVIVLFGCFVFVVYFRRSKRG